MSRLAGAFANGPVLVGFTVAGDPDFATSVAIAGTLVGAGVGVLELGVPFTDPVADGPVIQRAHNRALAAGATTDRLFDEVREIRMVSDIPIVLLVYYNIVFRRGVDAFCRSAAEAGVDGILVVDLPPEEAGDMEDSCRKHGIDEVFIVTPGTGDDRIRMISAHAGGFLYLTALLGVTGARETLSAGAAGLVARTRKNSALPLAVGFGISLPEHAMEIVAAGADGAIVGSAIVARIEENLADIPGMHENIRKYVETLRDAVTGRA